MARVVFAPGFILSASAPRKTATAVLSELFISENGLISKNGPGYKTISSANQPAPVLESFRFFFNL